MSAHNRIPVDADQSIITGFGYNPTVTVDDDGFLDNSGPQATSTVGNKMSREDLTKRYLHTLEEASEGSTGGFEQVKSTGSTSQTTFLKSADGRLAVPARQTSSLPQGKSLNRDSSYHEGIMAVPLIDVEGMSGLSSSRFLLDYTTMSTGEVSRTEKRQLNTCSVGESEERLNRKSASPDIIQAHTEADFPDYEDSDLSQGEVEDLPPVEGFYNDTAVGDLEGRMQGLPSSLLEPQQSLFEMDIVKEQDRTSKLVPSYLENKVGTYHADRYNIGDVLSNTKVHFDAGQISARSTTFGGGEEESKLLSTSCNSLGSLGEAGKEGQDDGICEHSRGVDSYDDWFEAEQGELFSMLDGETFHEPNLEFFEEEEKENSKAYKFMGMETVADNQLDISCFSGIHGVTEITVRPSWIRSPDKKFVGPGNKMLIDDYLKSRSEALGSLGTDGDENRPCFGKAVRSPPVAEKALPLIEMPMEESSLLPSYSQSDTKEAQEVESSKWNLEPDTDGQSFSGSSGSDTYCNVDQSNILTDKTPASEISEEMDQTPSTLVKTDYSKDNHEIVGTNSSKELRASCLNENKCNASGISSKLLYKTSEKFCEKSKDSECTELSKMEKAKNLEKTLNDIDGPIDAERISSLLSEALESDKPQLLIEKIIKMSQKTVLHKTLDVTDLDMSSEVLELRRQREALQSKQVRADQKAKTASVDRQNVTKEVNRKNVPATSFESKPLQQSQSGSTGRPVTCIPYRQMEKLNVSRTNSAPGDVVHTCQSNVKSNRSYTMFEDPNIDESIRMVQYKSTILEDTQKLQLPSFHDSDKNGFDSSTPYVPRSKSESNVPAPDDTSQGGFGSQIPIENDRFVPNWTCQRTLPRMGVLSSSSKLPVAVRQSKVPSHSGSVPLMVAAGMKNTLEMRGTMNSHNPTYTQGLTSQATNSRVFSSHPVTSSIRSTSVPTELQSLGMAVAPTQSLTNHPVNQKQTLRQHHSQENITQEAAEGTGKCELLSLPQRVVFPNVCVLGMASDVTVVFHNPWPRWIQISLRLLQETINSSSTAPSALLFKPSYFVEPRSKCEIQLSVCGQFKGLLEAMLEVRVSDLARDSATSTSSQVSVQTITVHANISEPEVQFMCDGEDALDFGVVPEGCTVSREVTVINQSPQSLPVILHLLQVAVTSPIFYWNVNKNESLKVVSPTHLACELPSASSDSDGPVPMTVTITLKAPHLDNVKVDESGVVGVRSHMQVELDTPDSSTIIISSFAIKAHIGAVRLESLRTIEPLVLETTSDNSSTSSIMLKNSSTFAVRISLMSREYQDKFTVHPDVMVIQPHSKASSDLVFIPKGREGRIESVLLMRVEPEGMEFELAIAGVSHAPLHVPILPGKQLALSHEMLTKSTSAPLPHLTEKNLSTALESTKSRLIFGTVNIGGRSSQKLVLRNNCTTQELFLILGISGSKAFQIGEYGSKEGKSRMDVVLKPCQELMLSVFMCPKTVEPLSATLICKYRGMANPFKCKIPLQGYGGKSELEIPDSIDDKPLVLRDLAPGLPTILHTAFVNRGERAMFLKLQVFTDEQCSELLPSADISVQPSEFVIAPKENRDVFLVANGTSHILAKTPGCVGVLLVIFGDEILRRRFRRLKNKEVKMRRINDPDLLKINWGVMYTGEKEVQSEEDSLPPQPEDSTIFFNSCSRIQVRLYGERQSSDDASSTVFACLDAEDTINSVADITALGESHYCLTLTGQWLRSCFCSTSITTSVTTVSNSVTRTSHNQSSNENSLMSSVQSMVQLVSDNVSFPDTASTRENYVKVQLRNLDSVIHAVKAEVSQGPFVVRHTQFRIKPGHYVSVPVYFKPRKTGKFSGQLKLTVLEDQKILTVKLSGKAVL
ncbi:uncharacterized protein [Panulirus ornatus]|uniref:uncharacterized protein n=1 Tax=Panulirus ornatus TaxID=150431 RepID=UPI003A87C9E9